MPDGLTKQEKIEWEIENAKKELTSAVLNLGKLVGVKEVKRITKNVYEELIF